MSKGAYIGINGVARKIKGGYVGVDGVARKIRKAYVGIGGVARPCWSGGELAYYGTVTALSQPRGNGPSGTIGDYAVFAYGYWYGKSNDMDAYNSSLTVTHPTTNYMQVTGRCGGRNANYLIFFGGEYNSSGFYYENADSREAYNASLTRTTSVGGYALSGANKMSEMIGDYALFVGGCDRWEDEETGEVFTDPVSSVLAINTSLTVKYPSSLNEGKMSGASAVIGGYAIFAGGYAGTDGANKRATTCKFDSSLTRTAATSLSVARSSLAATAIGNYALFTGGHSASGVSNVVDAYNSSLTCSTATALSVARMSHAATTLGKYAIFAGGSNSSSTKYGTVDVYDDSLTRTTGTSLSTARAGMNAETVGNYALFAGGSTDTYSNVVEAYTIA